MKIEDMNYEISNELIDEKDFNIENWRETNPMDYFKAMYLINTSSNKDFVFNTIYRGMATINVINPIKTLFTNLQLKIVSQKSYFL